MNNEPLNRLFRAAAQASPGTAPESAPPFGLETRVLSAWRNGRRVLPMFWSPALLFRGLAVCGLITAAAFFGTLRHTESPFADYLSLADSAVQSEMTP